MNPQKNQAEGGSALVQELQAEVSAESAPLLQFILRNAGVIATIVVIFVLALVGMGSWQWYTSSRDKDVREELTRTLLQPAGAERVAALKGLAERASTGTRVAVNMALGQNAAGNHDAATAAAAYGRVADADKGAMGMVAALEEASALLTAGKAEEAIGLLQKVRAALPPAIRAPQLIQALAEAAVVAGKPELAASAYLDLAGETQGINAAYFRNRAAALAPHLAEADAARRAKAAAPQKDAVAKDAVANDAVPADPAVTKDADAKEKK